MKSKEEIIDALKAKGWLEDDVYQLSHAIEWDTKINFEQVLNILGHWAKEHDCLEACTALNGLLDMCVYSYKGITRANIALDQVGSCEAEEKLKFYTEKCRDALDLKARIEGKYKLLSSLKAAAEGAVH